MNSVFIISEVGLWITVAFLTLATLVMFRQVGLIHKRLPPYGARVAHDGPTVGETAPPLSGEVLNGRAVELNGDREAMLVFVSPSCPACKEMLPGLRSVFRSERRRLDVILVSISGDAKENRNYVEANGINDVPFVLAPSLRDAYRVAGPPYAVVIGRDGLVKGKGIASNLEHFESLIATIDTGHPSVQSYLSSLASVATTDMSDESPAAMIK